MVFAGLYPVTADDYEGLRDAVEKLRLNDASFSFEPESSRSARLRLPLRLPRAAPHGDHPGAAGARVRPRADHHRPGGALHRPHQRRQDPRRSRAPRSSPTPAASTYLEEPYISATMVTRSEYVGGLLQLAEERRGSQQGLQYLDHRPRADRVRLPAAEVIHDFYDRLKSHLAGLRLVRLPARRLPAQASWSSSTSWSTASRWTRCR